MNGTWHRHFSTTDIRKRFFFKLADTKDCMVQFILAISAEVSVLPLYPGGGSLSCLTNPPLRAMGIQGLGLWAAKARRREDPFPHAQDRLIAGNAETPPGPSPGSS